MNSIKRRIRRVKIFFAIAFSFLAALGTATVVSMSQDRNTGFWKTVFTAALFAAMIAFGTVLLIHILRYVVKIEFLENHCLIETGLGKTGEGTYYLNYNEVYEIESRRGIFGNRPELIIIRAEVNGKKKTFRYRTGVRRRADELTFDQCKKHFTHAAVKE